MESWVKIYQLSSLKLKNWGHTKFYLGRQRTQHDLLRVKNVAQTHECKFKRIFAQHETNWVLYTHYARGHIKKCSCSQKLVFEHFYFSHLTKKFTDMQFSKIFVQQIKMLDNIYFVFFLPSRHYLKVRCACRF